MDDLYRCRKKEALLRGGLEESLDDFSVLSKELHRSDWERHLRKVLRRIGYDRFLLSLSCATTNDPFSRIMTTYPSDWLRRYKDENFIQVDPIIRHCRHHFVPLYWEAARRQARGRSHEFWKVREGYGLLQGVSIPLRCNEMVGSLNVALSMNSNDKLYDGLNSSLGKLFMLVPFLLEGSQKQLKEPREQFCSLTLRESEVLKWSGVGKTTWEISCILGCSERTINFHIANASRKLGSFSRRQAICVALAQGIISL
ncbi:LuxR family transcriptional regulator [Pseudomonas sp. Irchel 3A7]|uniref:helix-turn-helix transcriptional regulator n=1 Tax=Pseudomonas sp. Irchel 3A7 TaxID=2008913 RepID=UPI000BA467B2|nr:LuxR family transcriptional regulator [Pseudomonas sp. Irchel 3A7]